MGKQVLAVLKYFSGKNMQEMKQDPKPQVQNSKRLPRFIFLGSSTSVLGDLRLLIRPKDTF